jgi:HD-like signal output (HDOD) protein
VTRDAIIANIASLSVTPRVIRHLSGFLNDVNQDSSDVLVALRAEPVLASAIIAAANSPAYFRGERILDLEQAVMRLGFRETYRVTLLITFRQGLRVTGLPDNRAADYLWRRAITAACAMEELPQSGLDPTTAYSIGLLHLVGCLLLARGGSKDALFDCSNPAALARAQAASGELSHPEAAALAMEVWNFPSEVCAAIRWQYAPQNAGSHIAAALQLSRAANIASFIEECRPDSPDYHPPSHPMVVRELERTVERRSFDLMSVFHIIPPPRPAWADQ